MKEPKNWKQKLFKKELIHLMESGVHDWASMERNAAGHVRMRQEKPGGIDPCLTCRHICIKLGLPVEAQPRQREEEELSHE